MEQLLPESHASRCNSIERDGRLLRPVVLESMEGGPADLFNGDDLAVDDERSRLQLLSGSHQRREIGCQIFEVLEMRRTLACSFPRSAR